MLVIYMDVCCVYVLYLHSHFDCVNLKIYIFISVVWLKSNSFLQMVVSSYADQTCRSDEFTCASGRCIQVRYSHASCSTIFAK